MLFKSQLDGPLSLKEKKKKKNRREGRNRACAFLEEFRPGGCFADEKVLAQTPSRKASSAAARPAKMAAQHGLALLARQGPTGEGRRGLSCSPRNVGGAPGLEKLLEPAAKQTNSLSFCFFVFFLRNSSETHPGVGFAGASCAVFAVATAQLLCIRRGKGGRKGSQGSC